MVSAKDGNHKVRVIHTRDGSLITRSETHTLAASDGYVHPDLDKDITTIAVTERYMKGGNIGVGFIRGFGINEGAIASSIAHDSHNIITIATSPEDALMAVSTVSQGNGGIAAVNGRKILATLPLPIAGIITDEPVDKVARKLQAVRKAALDLGCQLEHPFLTLSFMALPVIPELRITDKGLVDVEKMKIVPVLLD